MPLWMYLRAPYIVYDSYVFKKDDGERTVLKEDSAVLLR